MEQKKRKPAMSVIIAAVLCLMGLCLALFVVGHSYLGLALILIGCVMLLYRWFHFQRDKHPKLIRWLRPAVTALLVIGTAYFLFLEVLIVRDAGTDTDAEADYIVVLGAGVNGTEPSLSLRYRLDAALAYLEEHPDTIAVVSGGQGPGEDITEARCMYDWLVQHGIDEQRILLEEQATSTMENLTFSMEIIQTRESGEVPVVGIVSGEYHLHRAKLMAAQAGYSAPVGIAASTGFLTLKINYFIREAFGLTHFYVFGR